MRFLFDRLQLSHTSGFTLLELMITVAIVGILAAIAIPSFQDYLRRTRMSELVVAVGQWKPAIVECYHDLDTMVGCNGGTNSIPNNITVAEEGIASLTVTDGQISVVPVARNGLTAADTLIYTPAPTANHHVFWTVSGGAVTAGYVTP